MNRQQLFSRIGRHRPVLYANGPWQRHHIGTPEWRAAPWLGSTWNAGEVLIDRPPRWLIRPGPGSRTGRLVDRWMAARWRRLLPDSRSGFIAYVFHPRFGPMVPLLGARHVVFHAYDWFERYRGWSERAATQQRELLRTADLVIASSDVIAEKLIAAGGRVPNVLPNGGDAEAFESAARAGVVPPAVAAIPRPRLGYIGSLNRKVDFDLIASLAARRPAWQFVLLGDIRSTGPDMDAAVARARQQPNVHFFDRVPPAEVPPYVAAMDVNLMIYRLSPDLWVEAGYPLKLHEYLAAGQPIVSTDLPSVRPFSAVVAIARTEAEWLDAIDAALRDGTPGSLEARRAVARENTWDARVRTLEGWLDALEGSR